MKTTLSTFRLFAEILAIIASVECGIMFLLPLIAPGVEGTAEALLDAAMLTLGAGPLLLWRVRAHANAMASSWLTEGISASEAETRRARARAVAYRSALDRHAIVAVTDHSGTITEVNDNFCRISGYSRAELIGAKHSIVNSGHHPSAFWVDMWQSIAGGGTRGRGAPGNDRMSLASYAASGGAPGLAGHESRVSSPGTRIPLLSDAVREGSDGLPEGAHAMPEASGAVPEVSGTVPEGGDAVPEVSDAVPEARGAVAEGGIWRAEVCNRAKDGSLYWVDTTIGPVRDEDGKTLGFISIRFDISERKRAESMLRESCQRLDRVLANISDALFMDDAEGRIVYANARFLEMFGIPAQEALSTMLEDYIAPEWRAELRDRHDRRLRGEPVSTSFEYQGLRRDGTTFWVEVSVVPVIENGRIIGTQSAARDISDRKQAERLLQFSHDHLERHVAERTELFAQAVEKAESASRAKSEFLAHMSHEIRTPINGVAGMLDLLSGTTLDQQQRRFTDLARISVGNLNSVINDVLDFSKIEAGRLDIVPDDFDLLTAIEDVVQMMAHRAQQKGLEITCAVEPSVPRRVRGDADRVRQILTNLVGNAIKFTTEGVVVVRVVLEGMHGGANGSHAGALVRFTISDTGIGIPEDRLERLFKAFSQADASTTRKYGGTGLGLAICKQLAELMGGTIGVVSEEGRGSTFWFTIACDAAKPDSAPAPAREHPLWGRRVLLVGGSPCHRDQLVEQCSAWGLRIDEAEDGDQGLAMLAEASESGDPFAVGFVDYGLGGTSSFEFAAAARRDPRLNSTALLLQHPMTTPVDPTRSSASGFAGDLAMPARQSQLLDALMNAMAGSGTASIASSPAAGQSQPPATGAGDRRLRILVAEDNEINQIVAREMLTRAGHDCEIVGNGQLAVEAVLAKQGTGEQYDLVLMDCQMPEMDGYDATREIRRHERDGHQGAPAGGRLPIVALTANAMQGDRERCLEAGMDAHASKPINPKQLLLTIDRVVRAQIGVQKAA